MSARSTQSAIMESERRAGRLFACIAGVLFISLGILHAL